MKKKYNPPRIIRNQAGAGNKIAFSKNAVHFQSKVEGIEVTELLENYGSPLFVFSESKMRESYRELDSIIKQFYPNSELSWSYKTNYLGAICSIFHQEGAKAEIVSIMEYDMAKHLGIAGEDIIFNGPGKRKEDLLRTIEDGVLIHIDHFNELITIEEVADELGITPKVAIRVNMDTGIYPQWQRFGFNYDNGEAYRTVQRLLSTGKVELVGLHAHIGTFMLDANPYYISASKLLHLAQLIKDN
ncbi:MAG: diaminopimelate decarboxylase, partial [Candidatus Cloacimonetes bacterium 4572_65]